jgi:hypothetical protein
MALQFSKLCENGVPDVITDTIPLDSDAINNTMDRLERFGNDVRVVDRAKKSLF